MRASNVAQNKKPKFKKNNKPEHSYKVIPKKFVKVNKKKHNRLKKPNKIAKLFINNRRQIFLLIVLIAFMALMLWYMNKAVENVTKSYENSVNTAKSFVTVDSREIQTASIVGPNEQLAKEIENYQSAPDDLKNFLLKDYRVYKGNCVVNGKLIGPLQYKIENVVYDQFARISRTCISNDSAILAKIGGRWAVVTSGNALPQCRVVNDLNIPQGVTFNCADGLVIYTNPNP